MVSGLLIDPVERPSISGPETLARPRDAKLSPIFIYRPGALTQARE